MQNVLKSLNVGLGSRSYPIYIAQNWFDNQIMREKLEGKQVLLVTNDTVAPLYLAKYEKLFAPLAQQLTSCILPDGEKFKNLDTLNQIYDQLLQGRYSRDCTLVALGGGVIGDMTGYAAATYQRGVNFIQIPTTLLSQVDSSVGGKTGVNHPLGKNMIGAFKQPRIVLIDPLVLKTLPPRELSAGLAEVIKYALIRDADFFVWLEQNIEKLLALDMDAISEAIYRSCEHKARIVEADEEEKGERALLNLGHTFGHAIETAVGYGNWLHGEAVAAGTMMAVGVSQRLGWLTEQDVQRIENLFIRAGIPVLGPNLGVDRYKELMQLDKKVKAGQLRLILLRAIGEGVIYAETPETILNEAILNGSCSNLAL